MITECSIEDSLDSVDNMSKMDADEFWTRFGDLCRIKGITQKQVNDALEVHLMPYFGGMRLDAINPMSIKNFRLLMSEKGLSNGTINVAMNIMRQILRQAFEEDLIQRMPFDKVRNLPVNSQKRDAFSMAETIEIFSHAWYNEVVKCCTLIAVVTGMRQMEIFAIRLETLHDSFIDVYDQMQGGMLVPCKRNSCRKVPVCPEVHDFIEKLIMDHGRQGFVPLFSKQTLSYSLRNAGRAAGISDEDWSDRHLCFHSWRHFYNTYLLSMNIPDIKVRAVLGHSSGTNTMTDVYTNWRPEMFPEVYEAQAKLWRTLSV